MIPRPMRAYAKLEMVRGLRNRSYVLFSIAFPLLIYLMNTGLGRGEAWRAEGLPASLQFMVSMAAFGVILTALGIGPRIAREQDVGWLAQLRVTPLRTRELVAGKLAVTMALVLPVLVVIFAAAALINGVTLPAGRWAAMIGVLWIGAAPFALLGVALGYATDADSANVANSGVLLLLAVLGGLFVPLESMPELVQGIGRALPSYRYADMAWSVAAAGAPALASVAVLAGWTALLGGAALASLRRAAVRA